MLNDYMVIDVLSAMGANDSVQVWGDGDEAILR
jgi:hypothetical protein